MAELTPKQIVEALDRHIVGQDDAKRAVAVAIRNRWRRQQLPDHMRQEVGPKNIIMIGPTGVGKTEIARRLAGLVNAPLVKVEASKYTEVGYHGRDVESMVRDLVDMAVHLVRSEQTEVVREEAERLTEEVILDALMPPTDYDRGDTNAESETAQRRYRSREKLRTRLHDGEMEDSLIELSIEEKAQPIGMFATVGADQMGPDIQSLLDQFMPSQSKPRRLPVREARKLIFEQQCDQLIDRQKVNELAVQRTENSGILFIDEIDKICGPQGAFGPEVSRQGVQRDLLPIVEGCTVNTRCGSVRTDHILCIAAGAFHNCKPSDLMPELQGRFPIRVELTDLTAEDFRRILTEPEGALVKQQIALMSTEGVTLAITDDAITAVAEISYKTNQNAQNIGARRLHAATEKLMETLSFDAPDRQGQSVTIDEDYVRERLAGIAEDETLIRFGFHSLREDR